MSFTVRLSKPGDISSMADVGACSNVKDELTLYMTKDILKYWTSYRNGTIRLLKGCMQKSGVVCYVCETSYSSQGSILANDEKRVVGWATWTRTGNSEQARKWQAPSKTVGARIEQALKKIEDKYVDLFRVDCTTDEQHRRNILPILDHEFDKEVFDEAWELNGLNVHPEYQRRGVGQMLLQSGMDIAKQEGVPIVVKASPTGLRLYEKNGFRRIEKIDLEPWVENLRSTEGCWTLVWEPQGCNGRWWERAVDKVKNSESGNGKDSS